MRRVHLAVGLLGVAGFALTGLYMDRFHDHLRGMDDARRLLFRSTHIYLLLASLLNLALGLHLSMHGGWRLWLQRTGSAIVLATPFLAAAGFSTEPWLTGLQRPYSRAVAYGAVAGMMLHLFSNLRRNHRTSRPTASCKSPTTP